jgi:hypothetical protein
MDKGRSPSHRSSHNVTAPDLPESVTSSSGNARCVAVADSPSPPTPSQADIQMTKATIEIAKPLVHDHIIAGKNTHASRKGLKLIWSSPAFTIY